MVQPQRHQLRERGGLDSPGRAVVGGLAVGLALSYVSGFIPDRSALVPVAALAAGAVRPGRGEEGLMAAPTTDEPSPVREARARRRMRMPRSTLGRHVASISPARYGPCSRAAATRCRTRRR